MFKNISWCMHSIKSLGFVVVVVVVVVVLVVINLSIIDYIVFNAFLTVFQFYRSGHFTYLWFPRFVLTSTPHDILFKPLTAFPQNHC